MPVAKYIGESCYAVVKVNNTGNTDIDAYISFGIKPSNYGEFVTSARMSVGIIRPKESVYVTTPSLIIPSNASEGIMAAKVTLYNYNGKFNTMDEFVDATAYNLSTTPSIKGTLRIISTPSNAAVYINDVLEGYTPFSKDLDAGTYNIKLVLSGYYDDVFTANVTAGRITEIYRTLTPIPAPPEKGTLIITTSPQGANVYLNNEFYGKTPLIIYTTGRYIVRISLSGYFEEFADVTVSAGQTVELSRTLAPIPELPQNVSAQSTITGAFNENALSYIIDGNYGTATTFTNNSSWFEVRLPSSKYIECARIYFDGMLWTGTYLELSDGTVIALPTISGKDSPYTVNIRKTVSWIRMYIRTEGSRVSIKEFEIFVGPIPSAEITLYSPCSLQAIGDNVRVMSYCIVKNTCPYSLSFNVRHNISGKCIDKSINYSIEQETGVIRPGEEKKLYIDYDIPAKFVLVKDCKYTQSSEVRYPKEVVVKKAESTFKPHYFVACA